MGAFDTIIKVLQSGWLWGPLALFFWVAAWVWYLRGMIRTAWKERRPHRWGVDMNTRQVTAGKPPVI
jgi:hypothetical protein